jgi:hypothetical protein
MKLTTDLKIMNIEISPHDVIEKYFKDEKCIYPIIPDMQKDISGEFFLAYRKNGGIELYAGTDDGEILICKTRSGEKLERVILAFV